MNSAAKAITLVGCGILRREMRFLVRKNSWPLADFFLDSGLHTNFQRLATGLTFTLKRLADRPTIVTYGACHPLMDVFLRQARTIQLRGQNCIEMLLGREAFSRRLAAGAFFLLEDWASRWEKILALTIGGSALNEKSRNVVREIFHFSHTHLLALHTPCSGDFTPWAIAMSHCLALPLHHLEVSLDHLESVMKEALIRKQENAHE